MMHRRILPLTLLFLLIVLFAAIPATAVSETIQEEPEPTVVDQPVGPQTATPSSMENEADQTDQTDQGGLTGQVDATPCTKTEGCTLPDGHEGDCNTPITEVFEPTMTVAEFSELLQGPSVTIEGNILIDSSIVIPSETMVTVSGGTVVIAEGTEVINNGFLQISGGQLIVRPDASLSNNMFLLVNEQGSILLEEGATYANGLESALLLDRSAPGATADIDGISRALIECTVYAPDADAFFGMLATDGYRMLTIVIDPSTDMDDISLPDHVAIMAR